MAIQILPTTPGAGSQLGRSLGSGLEALAEYKVNQLIQQQNERRTAGDLEAAGFSAAEAKVLAGLPPQQRASLLQRSGPAAEEMGFQQSAPSQEGGLQNLQQFASPQPLNQQMNLAQTMQALGLPYNPQSLSQTFGMPQAQERMAQFNQPRQMAGKQVAQAPIQQQPAVTSQPEVQAPVQEQKVAEQPKIQKPKLTALGRLAAGQAGTPAQQAAAQTRIERMNKPFVDTIRKNAPVAQEQAELAQEIIDLVNTGKVAEGWAGWAQSHAPISFMNDETQRALTKMKRLANLEAKGMGVITNAKLKLAQDIKPSLDKSRNVQLAETQDILRRAQRFLKMNDLIDQYSEGGQPENLEKLVTSQLQQESSEQPKLSKETLAEKPSAASAPGRVIQNEETGEFEQSIDGEWVPVKKVSGKWVRA